MGARWEEGVAERRRLEGWVRVVLRGEALSGGRGTGEEGSGGSAWGAEGMGREKEPPEGGSQSCIVYSSFFRSSSGLSGWR